jgi:P-aminobenzoate N-oxygenase AurF
MTAKQTPWDVQLFNKLTQVSVSNDYNPYTLFEWPDQLSDDQWWMSQDLLSVYETPLMDSLDESTLKKLSKWESINFYSLNIHGIRELLSEVSRRIYTPGFEIPSEFFHRFIAEENHHMWFFAQFCLRYGSKIYPDKSIKFYSVVTDPRVESFLVFARIVIFEEIVDYFNVRMGNDEDLHPLMRDINRVHHEDESRHIAAGRQIVKQLYTDLTQQLELKLLRSLDDYLQRYILTMLESLYNPAAYRDAGIPESYKMRSALLQQASRKHRHRAFVHRTMNFLLHNHILSGQEFLT